MSAAEIFHLLGVFAFFLYSAAHAKRKLFYLPRVTEELARDIRIVFFFFFLLVFTHRCNTVPTNARSHGLSGSLLIYSSRVDHLSSIIYAHVARLFIFANHFSLASRPSSSPLLPSSSTLPRKIIPHFLPRPQHRNIIISRNPNTTFFLPPPAPAPPPPPRLLSTSQTPRIHRRRKPRSFSSSSSSSSETSNRPCGSFTLSKTLAGVDFLL